MKIKSLFFLIAIISVALISCQKNYSCDCTDGAIGLSDDWEDLNSREAEDAEKACEENSKFASISNNSCSFSKE
jgi:hypothetical protein